MKLLATPSSLFALMISWSLLSSSLWTNAFVTPSPSSSASRASLVSIPTSSSRTTLFEQRLAEKVLQNPKWPEEWPYTAQDLARADEEDDGIFYQTPRLCTHIDDPAIMALTNHYASVFNDGDDVLDICSSWISHYPPSSQWTKGKVVGLGMNEYELSQNKILDSYTVQDLNINPTFPYQDNSFDKVTCVVSIDYLTQPKQVFQEIGRVLKPGGMALMAISNRCFPTKAWNLWLRTNDLEHVFIVGSFYHLTKDKENGQNVFEAPDCVDVSPNPGRSDPMYIIRGIKKNTIHKVNIQREEQLEKNKETNVTSANDDVNAVIDNKVQKSEETTGDSIPNKNVDNTSTSAKKRKDVMDFLRKKGAVGKRQDFSKAKGVDEGPGDKSLEDFKTIQKLYKK